MNSYSIEQLSQVCKGELIAKVDSYITHLLIDSRLLSLPSESLFFAIKSIRDGHHFVKQLYQKGVRNFVISNYSDEFKKLDANFILVKNTVQALHQISKYHREQSKAQIFGITGSNGKTITKEWLFQVFEGDREVVRNPRSYNSQFGVPLSVWNLKENHEIGFFEAGISKPSEMQNLQKIIQPEVGIFTYLGIAHQANFKDREQKLLEKLQLFKNSKLIIYNSDDELVDYHIKKLYPNTRKFCWSYMQDSHVRIEKVEHVDKKSIIRYVYRGDKYDLEFPFIDSASISNMMLVLCAMLTSGYSYDQIFTKIRLIHPVAMRLEVKEGISNCVLINDSYNSDINSLDIALSFTNSQTNKPKKTLILSDIYQSKLENEALYSKVSSLLKQYSFDRIIGVGAKIQECQYLFDQFESMFFSSTENFISYLSSNKLFSNEAILLKGARVFKFENLSDVLESRVHQTVMEVNLHSMAKNLNYFKSKLNASTEIMVMVKAFSYGTGSYEVASLLQSQGADYLAVAFVDEAVELRRNGITIPIVVMNPEEHSFHAMVENNLEPEIYNFRILKSFINYLKQCAVKYYPVHIKLDSGMHRSGFEAQDIDQLTQVLLDNSELFVSSVFSHLAGSDSQEFDSFTNKQVTVFQQSVTRIKELTQFEFKTHILNSAGIERFPQFQFDMVRLGVGLYGVACEANDGKIENVVSLKTTINQLKYVKKDETVGYNRNAKLTQDSKIAILPIGYADGINRKLGNNNYSVLINGVKAPIIGNICMDMCMVDVSHLKQVNEGDEVIVFGENNSLLEMAKSLDTIAYEILTSISRRVKRIYYR